MLWISFSLMSCDYIPLPPFAYFKWGKAGRCTEPVEVLGVNNKMAQAM
jgi:hypothetical protein